MSFKQKGNFICYALQNIYFNKILTAVITVIQTKHYEKNKSNMMKVIKVRKLIIN